MPTSSWTKFDQFVEDKWHGVHDFSSDTFTYALCNEANAPDAGDAVLADLTEISYTNVTDDGPGSREVAVASSGQTSGNYVASLTDFLITAVGGAIAPFRYVVIFNNTPTSPLDPLVGMLDYGADVSLAENESLNADFAADTLTES